MHQLKKKVDLFTETHFASFQGIFPIFLSIRSALHWNFYLVLLIICNTWKNMQKKNVIILNLSWWWLSTGNARHI